jgi:hydrogenase expression/formation protein HypC
MCLALPLLVKKLLPDGMALVDLDGVGKEISVALVEGVQEGDYVIVHVGFALSKLDPEEAARTLALFEQAAAVMQ